MAAPSNSDYELLTEHFSYPPVSLLDDIINTVNVLADRALDSVERLLLSIPPQKLGFTSSSSSSSSSSNKSKSKNAGSDPAAADLPPDEAAKLEIENGTHQLETLLNASIDKNFDIFELYVMQNILTVKPHDQPYMRLSHYEGLDFSSSSPSSSPSSDQQQQQQQLDRPTPESITALRRRLQASQKLNAVLEAEKARNDALLQKLRRLLGVQASAAAEVVKPEDKDRTAQTTTTTGSGSSSSSSSRPFGFLRDKGGLEESGGDQPITTTTEFTLSQLQALRSLSTSLRTLLPDLAPPTEPDGDDNNSGSGGGGGGGEEGSKRSWRRERAEYIESSSRKYLETVVGLELGPRGEVRDGEWQGEGRGLSKGEVEGLEKAVALLGGGKEGVTAAAAAAAASSGSASGSAEGSGGSRGDDDDAMDES